ncbi:hypothetical protein PR003_g4031 [Phytophthora rubi]|uniref:Uncharacterized protein n=1 Tax=Phytophthora rubi TaxID=129364 RepID=A0A6A3LA52_9STRA|nr:hypothetical protein PR002_g15093 [Phytophthora rubi]KAE9016291.1 hypothetical protein PR001_g14698 [Phytophthora rubi]KAE9353132.1 hypothetical protein PR003_g4031 [Phytophthora rubi]
MAQTQARAVAEAHAVQHAEANDIRMPEAFKQLEIQLHAHLDHRMRDVLTAHMEQVDAAIRLAIEAQGQEIVKLMQNQLDAFEKGIIARIEDSRRFAEKKAKSTVRRHHAEENAAHEDVKLSLWREIAECKASVVDTAVHRADSISCAFASTQADDVVGPSARSSTRPSFSPGNAQLILARSPHLMTKAPCHKGKKCSHHIQFMRQMEAVIKVLKVKTS